MLKILNEESKLADIVQLVGEDVLQMIKMVLEISRVLRIGFLQQNAFHDDDTYVPLPKQYLMLELIKYLYDRANEAVKYGIPISIVKDETLFNSVMKMKYTIPNEDLRGIGRLMKDIDDYYSELISRYREKIRS